MNWLKESAKRFRTKFNNKVFKSKSFKMFGFSAVSDGYILHLSKESVKGVDGKQTNKGMKKLVKRVLSNDNRVYVGLTADYLREVLKTTNAEYITFGIDRDDNQKEVLIFYQGDNNWGDTTPQERLTVLMPTSKHVTDNRWNVKYDLGLDND